MTLEQILTQLLRDAKYHPNDSETLVKIGANQIREWVGEVLGTDETRPTSWANKQTLELEWRARQIRNHNRTGQRQRAGIKEK